MRTSTLALLSSLAACVPGPDESAAPVDDPASEEEEEFQGDTDVPDDDEPLDTDDEEEPVEEEVPWEHPPEAPHGIDWGWDEDFASGDVQLLKPVLDLTLTNLEDQPVRVSVRPLGDNGVDPTFLGEEAWTTLEPGAIDVPVSLNFEDLVYRGPLRLEDAIPQAFSGTVTAQVQACPADGSPCQIGTLAPLFHHVDPPTGEVLVYDQAGLCDRHQCGDLLGRAPEAGTTRVVATPSRLRLQWGELDPTPTPDPHPGDVTSGITEYDVCLNVDVLIADAGQSPYGPGGLTEDYWSGANDPSSFVVRARGFRARIQGPGIDETIDSDPSNGCFSFKGMIGTRYDIVVYAYATDSADNVFRVHDAGTDTSSWYPGKTLSMKFANQLLDSDSTNHFVIDGRTDDQWTVAAVGAYALYRFHDGASNRTLSVGWADSCSNSGSTHGDAEEYIESHNAHLFRIGRCGSPSTDTREKMMVTHEMGHAMLRMHYGYDGDDGPRDQDWDPNSDPGLNLADPGNGKRCVLFDDEGDPTPNSYSIHTVEFNSQAFKEGYADFWSARVWNKHEPQAIYVYRSDVFDLETWDTFGWGLDTWGGFTTNWCEVADPDDVSTKGDWTRFLWDVYTDPNCEDVPTRLELMDLYRDVRENHRTGDYELTTVNYDQAMMHAMAESDLDTCVRDRAQQWANWNGI